MTTFSTVQYIVGSTVYDLYGRDPYGFISLTGVGLPPTRRQKERGPQQNGSTDVGYLIDERILNLAIIIVGDTRAEVAASRRQLAHILKPSNTSGKLRVTGEDSLVRQIDCNPIGMVDFPNTFNDRIGPSQLVVAQFEAADPIPYDPIEQIVTFNIGGGNSGFAVPSAVPFVTTTSDAADLRQTFIYDGDWQSNPVIYLVGPMVSPVITNTITNKTLDMTGTTITDGDIWTIDLRYRAWSVTDSSGTLHNDALTDASNLLDFAIMPDPDAIDGVNEIRFQIASGVTAVTSFSMHYYNRYPSLE